MDEHRLELKVGLLIVLALAGCVALLYLLGELRLTGGGHLTVQLSHTGGVPEGAPVKFAGVRAGRVSSLKVFPSRRDATGAPLPVEMELEIDRKIFDELTAKARFVVATQGPLGEPFLEIDPGPASSDKLDPKQPVRGVDPPRMDLLSSKVYSFVDEATQLLGSGGDATTVVQRVTSLAEKAEGTLDQARPGVLAAVKDLSEAAHDLKALSRSASAMLAERGSGRLAVEDLAAVSAQLRKDVPASTERALMAADGAAAVAGAFNADDAQKLKDAIARYEKAGQTLGTVADRADRLLARIEAGEGTIGGLSRDPAVYQDLKSLVTDLKKHPWKVLWKE